MNAKKVKPGIIFIYNGVEYKWEQPEKVKEWVRLCYSDGTVVPVQETPKEVLLGIADVEVKE